MGGLLVADALTVFSYDIVRMVLEYGGLFTVAQPGAQPRFLFKFGAKGTQLGQFHRGCYGMAVNRHDDTIWVGDCGSCQIFSASGQWLREAAQGQLSGKCTSIVFDNKEAFLLDQRGDRILVCSFDGKFVREIANASCAQALRAPWGACSDGNGMLYIADTENNRIVILRRDGTWVGEFGCQGSSDGAFFYPLGVALKDSEVWVTDQNNKRVQIFEAGTGKFRRKFSGIDFPFGIVFDRVDNAIVCDMTQGCVRVFSAQGEFITKFGEPGSRDGEFYNVRCCAIALDGTIFVGDENKYVQAFAF